jgi:hypothetical protein
VPVLTTGGAALDRLTAEFFGKLRPSFRPAVVDSNGAQGEHGVDRRACPVHATAFEARLNDEFVSAFDSAISDGPACGLKGRLIQLGLALGQVGEGLCEFKMVGLCGGELACSG